MPNDWSDPRVPNILYRCSWWRPLGALNPEKEYTFQVSYPRGGPSEFIQGTLDEVLEYVCSDSRYWNYDTPGRIDLVTLLIARDLLARKRAKEALLSRLTDEELDLLGVQRV